MHTHKKHKYPFRNLYGLVGGVILLSVLLACSSGLPELRPGYFEQPVKTKTHGRIVEKRYRFNNGPRTVNYAIFEVDGKALKIPGGFVEFTSFSEVEGVDAVGFTVRGKPDDSGIYVLQVAGDEIILERVCDYGTIGAWKNAVFAACETSWDAAQRKRFPTPPFRPNSEKRQP